MGKKCIRLLMLSVILVSMIFPVCAQELPEVTRRGSLEIVMEYEGEPLVDGSLTICKVGDIEIRDGNSGFVLVESLTGGPSLEDIHAPALAEELAELAREKGLSMLRGSIQEGRARFSELEVGLYVVIQQEGDATEGFAPIRPFLLSLPVWAEEAYQYDLQAVPKVPLVTEPIAPTTPTEPPAPDLPQTGQLNWPIPVLVVMGLGFFALGWILRLSGRREHHES